MDGQRQGGQAMLPAGLDSDWINSWTESLSMVPLTLAVKMDENEEKTEQEVYRFPSDIMACKQSNSQTHTNCVAAVAESTALVSSSTQYSLSH